jgi:hypothetical protein
MGVQVHEPLKVFRKAYVSVRSAELCTILIWCGVLLKLVRLIRICLYETQSNVHRGKYLSDTIVIKNGLKQRDDLLSLLFNFSLVSAIRKVQANHMG